MESLEETTSNGDLWGVFCEEYEKSRVTFVETCRTSAWLSAEVRYRVFFHWFPP